MNGKLTCIRIADPDDLAEIQRCNKAAYGKYISRMDKLPAPMTTDLCAYLEQQAVYVAFYDTEFAGYIIFYEDNDHMLLESVAVVPEHQGKGIGRELINYVEKIAVQKGLSAIALYTNEAMIGNLMLYPKLGYVETGRRQEDGFNRVFFQKYL